MDDSHWAPFVNSGVRWHLPFVPSAFQYSEDENRRGVLLRTFSFNYFVLSLSTTALSWWGGAAFLVGPMFPHRRLVTLLTFWCPGQEKLMDGKQVRGGHAVLIRFVRVFYRQA